MLRQDVRRIVNRWFGAAIVGLLALATPIVAHGQNGEITGRITDQTTGQPVSTVQVFLQGTSYGTITGQGGTFTLSNIPPGRYVIIAQRIGYQPGREETTVGAGATASVTMTMAPQVLQLQEIVATGLVDPVEGARSPVTVSRISREHMPTPVAGAAVQNVQGRMPGVTISRTDGGQPGSDISVMLRTPTSAMPDDPQFQGPTSSPLIVVDGVILGVNTGTANIESLDIESIEVIKGAAAASLYGSRAAAGVIAITTSRGQGLAIGQTQFQMRSEMGFSQVNRETQLPSLHHFRMNADRTAYVNAAGQVVPARQRSAAPFAIIENPYLGPTYDNIAAVFQPGGFSSQNLTISQNTAGTNFAITLNRLLERGPLENHMGYERNSFRMNLDHRFMDALSLSVSGYHSRDVRDEMELTFTNIINAPADIDLSRKDEQGQYLRLPDPDIPYENPLWRQASRDHERRRVRTLGAANLRWDPLNWLNLSGNVSYDRQDGKEESWVPKGTPLSATATVPADGSMFYENLLNDAMNAEAQASLRRSFGLINARTTVRNLVEIDRQEMTRVSASNFYVTGVPRIDAAANRDGSSEMEEIRAVGYLWDTALDYDGKYIGTVLLRRDGSSLFGADNRWHNYYRAAFAWRLGEEPWFNLPNVDEVKLSFARGTAGGRPQFWHQYETWSVGPTGVTRGRLGNRNLRPEHTTENEASLDVVLYQRFGLRLTQAWQKTEHQIVTQAIPAFTGSPLRWTNMGTVIGNTTEASLEAQILQRPGFGWNSMWVFDRSGGKISDWPAACLPINFRFACEGVPNYSMWAGWNITSFRHMETHHGGSAMPFLHEFQIDGEGNLVWVGEGNNWTDGLWGRTRTINGFTYQWGMPFQMADADASRRRSMLGSFNHVNFGWLNNFRMGQVTLHSHVHAALGGVQSAPTVAYNTGRNPRLANQENIAREMRRPIAYWVANTPPGTGNLAPRSFVKLRTLSLGYNVGRSQINRFGLNRMGLNNARLGLTGRDLLFFTQWPFFDPEVGDQATRRLGTTPAIYPSTRTLTADLTITF
jgi:TonB-linked SusC/RagA family outer membrane protein